MKPIFLVLFILLFSNCSVAQGNLQFNKVVFIEADTTLICNQGGFCVDSFLIRDIIVQTGKVLKIESVNFTSFSGFYGFYLSKKELNASSNIYPIWLPSGIYRVKYKAFGSMNPSPSGFNVPVTYHVSAIEFNIVQ